MTGISEILVLILLITAILILPRMLKPAPTRKGTALPSKKLGKKMRAAIVLSAAYPALAALFINPWDGNLLLFAGAGILPVVLAWALFWIFSAPKK